MKRIILLMVIHLCGLLAVNAEDNSYCIGETAVLEAKGEKVRWYADKQKSKLLHEGNTYQITVTQPDTFFVTRILQNQETIPDPFILMVGDPVIANVVVTHASCSNDNGTISVTALGEGLTYSLDNGVFQTSPSFSSLYSKTFQLTVKSATGCLATREVEIQKKSIPSFVMVVILNPCEFEDKDLSAVALGGYGTITYALDEGPFQQSGLFSDLKSGSYTLRAKDSLGCEISMETTVPDKNQAVKLHDVDVEHARCGGEFGLVTLLATGSGQLQYSLDGADYVDSPNFSSVLPGAYTAFVRDGAGCTDSTEIIIGKTPAPRILEVIASNASCREDDGAVVIHANGSGPLLFSVDAVNYVTDTVFTGLSPLVQTVYVKDTAGCDVARSVIIGRDCLDNVYIPAAFSPDQDGTNEVMEVKFSVASVKITAFRLFNRWGNVITSTTNKTVQSGAALWDGLYHGTRAQPGVYPYQLDIEFDNGQKQSVRNSILLMR